MAREVRAREADIPMGMTQIEDGDAKVLVIRDETGLRAFQAKLPDFAVARCTIASRCGSALSLSSTRVTFSFGFAAFHSSISDFRLPEVSLPWA